MSRRRKKKKPTSDQPIQATVTPIRRTEVQSKRREEFIYVQILPHEIVGFIPLIKDFYRAINFKEAMENPDPFIREINREMSVNPYSIFYVCMDQELKPHGYYWFRVDKNVLNQNYLTIEHDYVIPEHRGTLTEARMHDRFIAYAIEIGERCNAQRVSTMVRSKTMLESRKKLGFVPVEMKITFEGDADAFRNVNPRFQRYSRYSQEEYNGRKQAINETES